MMQLAQRALLVVLLLVASVGTASGECAWVLWGESVVINADGVRTASTSILGAWGTRDECQGGVRDYVTFIKGQKPPDPSKVEVAGSTVLIKGEGKSAMALSWQCLPDTVDPRGPKGK